MQEVMIKKTGLSFQTQEAFNTLRSNIEFAGKNIRSVCITSCTSGEGKSEISFELAKAFAWNGKNVLLVDADLRRSSMLRYVESGVVPYGLFDCLAGKCEMEESICHTDIAGLHIVFSGHSTPIPSELLGGHEFAEFMETAKQQYDYVIVDTPPLGLVIDAAIVGKLCDGTIMVIQSETISRRFARNVLAQLHQAGNTVLGCVLNKENRMVSRSRYGGYYDSYYGIGEEQGD